MTISTSAAGACPPRLSKTIRRHLVRIAGIGYSGSIVRIDPGPPERVERKPFPRGTATVQYNVYTASAGTLTELIVEGWWGWRAVIYVAETEHGEAEDGEHVEIDFTGDEAAAQEWLNALRS